MLDVPTRRRGIIPAHAGSTRLAWHKAFPLWDHPRSRGEHTSLSSSSSRRPGSSPLTRGALHHRFVFLHRGRIIPAHAGSTTTTSWVRRSTGDHPRSRGEHSSTKNPATPTQGSSPLTRGARISVSRCATPTRIIPAHAGSTPSSVMTGVSMPDHPRSRGEHVHEGFRRMDHQGSSPLTRGAQTLPGARSPRPWIIPAHAGSTMAR